MPSFDYLKSLFINKDALESVMCDVIKKRLKGGMQKEVK